eukprot:694078-Lingulodinium_polyedra.AAC.1
MTSGKSSWVAARGGPGLAARPRACHWCPAHAMAGRSASGAARPDRDKPREDGPDGKRGASRVHQLRPGVWAWHACAA